MMSCEDPQQNIRINTTNAVCPIGEATGKKNIREKKRSGAIRGRLGSRQPGNRSCRRIVHSGSNEDAMRRRLRVIDYPQPGGEVLRGGFLSW
jgi:hypothetical protein